MKKKKKHPKQVKQDFIKKPNTDIQIYFGSVLAKEFDKLFNISATSKQSQIEIDLSPIKPGIGLLAQIKKTNNGK